MPSNTIFRMFFYVYVLESIADLERYVGYTRTLGKRIEEHQAGHNFPRNSDYRLN
jgi:predicted GIY-YIG superfamily endonuclease